MIQECSETWKDVASKKVDSLQDTEVPAQWIPEKVLTHKNVVYEPSGITGIGDTIKRWDILIGCYDDVKYFDVVVAIIGDSFWDQGFIFPRLGTTCLKGLALIQEIEKNMF